MKKEKQLYKITLNWQREMHTIYRWATTEDNALRFAFLALAKELGIAQKQRISNYFLGGQNNFEIVRVKRKEK
jgi:hypothetical protein